MAAAGQSVSDYLLTLVTEMTAGPTMAEVVERSKVLARSGGGTTLEEAVAAVRAGRDR